MVKKYFIEYQGQKLVRRPKFSSKAKNWFEGQNFRSRFDIQCSKRFSLDDNDNDIDY